MNILIIEDEARIAKRIHRMTSSILQGESTCINICSTLEEGKAFIKIHPIDLLFLDLNLNGEDGFEILKSVVSESFQTIIISAYKDKAITAFEYGVLDFVSKPFTEERLAKACQRHTQKQVGNGQIKYLSIHKKERKILININEINYIKGASVYSEIVQKNGEKDLHNKTLDSLSKLLPDSYERIHKSYIVNMNLAAEVISEPGSKYTLRLKDDTMIPISRSRIKEIREKWFA